MGRKKKERLTAMEVLMLILLIIALLNQFYDFFANTLPDIRWELIQFLENYATHN